VLGGDDRKANHCKEIHAQQGSSYKSGWHDTTCHPIPIGDEGICARVGLHVASRHRLQPRGGPVNGGQQVHLAFRRSWQRTHQVYVHMGNLHAGTGMAWSGAAGCLWTFPLWHCWQSQHIAVTSLPTPFQTKWAVIICLVARMPGWATRAIAWKTAALSGWHQRPCDGTCHITQQAGPLYLDRPHCQGIGLNCLLCAKSLAGRHPGEGDACSWLHVSQSRK
jgi:hypothetical protein